MIIETLILGIIAGKFKGGKVGNLSEIPLEKWGFIPVGFLISYISIFLIVNGNVFFAKNFAAIQLISNFLLLTTLFCNRKEKRFIPVAAGIVLNLIPMILNGGRMPVSRFALEKASLTQELELIAQNRIATHSLIDNTTAFKFLSDIIPLPYKVISAGDMFIALGIFLIILKYMTLSQPLQRN